MKGERWLCIEGDAELLFTENDTNLQVGLFPNDGANSVLEN
jgi:hypothetical protein